MRTFIVITAAESAKGVAEFSTVTAEDLDDLRKKVRGTDSGKDDKKGKHPPVLAVEVPNDSQHVLPGEDDLSEDGFDIVELAEFSEATRLDAAGVQRSAAGRPIDAPPGSKDAADTGMQHDIGSGTVKNTVSPEPTPSPVLAKKLAEDPDMEEQPTPKAAQATTR